MCADTATGGSGRRRHGGRSLAVRRARVLFAEFWPQSQRILSALAALACVAVAVYLGLRHGPEARVQRATDLVAGGEYRQAITEAQPVRGFPADRDALLIRAEADAALGRPAQAAAIMQRAVRLDPENATFRYDLAVDLLNAGDRRGARTQMARALALDPKELVPPAFGSIRPVSR